MGLNTAVHIHSRRSSLLCRFWSTFCDKRQRQPFVE